MLFGLGKVPAIFATVTYAAPPLIRLTDLGIRQVDSEVTEAVNAFGANRWQQLFGAQLPLPLPSIMAGVNQSTILA
ncbi:ABC transporter permease subunit, partial [Pseudomonas aeruginosa]